MIGGPTGEAAHPDGTGRPDESGRRDGSGHRLIPEMDDRARRIVGVELDPDVVVGVGFVVGGLGDDRDLLLRPTFVELLKSSADAQHQRSRHGSGEPGREVGSRFIRAGAEVRIGIANAARVGEAVRIEIEVGAVPGGPWVVEAHGRTVSVTGSPAT